ncbi:hypothetical protein [Streptomyces sp. G1]|uniref:hypothetical protein n=1 Tax=Streptomyces sp. G1 TaxID=361572 RepID=UPI002030542C|nr:hypothetical protein [Streptomyces sp. G1]MCM1968299.1 hypothetical protein [Streptomyces sp. G1]
MPSTVTLPLMVSCRRTVTAVHPRRGVRLPLAGAKVGRSTYAVDARFEASSGQTDLSLDDLDSDGVEEERLLVALVPPVVALCLTGEDDEPVAFVPEDACGRHARLQALRPRADGRHGPLESVH